MSADFIYTLNVLEHIENDHLVLLQLFATLKPGGRLLVYVPAFAILYTSMDRKVGHYRRYSRQSLVGALRQAGFQVDDARYVDCMGFLATLLYRLVDNKEGDINPSALRLYDRVAFPVSRALDRNFSRLFGKNLLVYARRPEGARRSSKCLIGNRGSFWRLAAKRRESSSSATASSPCGRASPYQGSSRKLSSGRRAASFPWPGQRWEVSVPDQSR